MFKTAQITPEIFKQFKKIHLIGAGGIGMRGLDTWLRAAGYTVTGSDDAVSGLIPESSVDLNADCIVVSSAISQDHSQYRYAIEHNIPILHRAAATKLLVEGPSVVISGAHGKTTCTALISFILTEYSNYKTAFLVGGELKNLGISAKSNPDRNDLYVLEGDESDNSMNVLAGTYHLLANIGHEHIDYYSNFENYLKAIENFAQAPEYLVAHISCKEPLELKSKAWFYGPDTDIYLQNIRIQQDKMLLDACGPWGTYVDLETNLFGEHMAWNILGSLTILHLLGLTEAQIREGLRKFVGVKRRMELFEYQSRLIIQDYAVHPHEVYNVLINVKRKYSEYSLKVIWQPHRFSRIGYQNNLALFKEALDLADDLAIMPVWAASEKHNPEVIDRLNELFAHARPLHTDNQLKDYIESAQDNEIVIALGAGNIYKKVSEILLDHQV